MLFLSNFLQLYLKLFAVNCFFISTIIVRFIFVVVVIDLAFTVIVVVIVIIIAIDVIIGLGWFSDCICRSKNISGGRITF